MQHDFHLINFLICEIFKVSFQIDAKNENNEVHVAFNSYYSHFNNPRKYSKSEITHARGRDVGIDTTRN